MAVPKTERMATKPNDLTKSGWFNRSEVKNPENSNTINAGIIIKA